MRLDACKTGLSQKQNNTFQRISFFPQRTSERTAHRNENLVTDTRDDIKQSYIVTSSPLTKQRKCLISWHFGKVS